jgi:hypothetical protein
LADFGIGLGPLAARLRLEDAPVAVAIVVAQYRGQIGRRHLVELDDRRRRHEHRMARQRTGSRMMRRGGVRGRLGAGRRGDRLGAGNGLLWRLGGGLGEGRSSDRGQRPRQHHRHELFHGGPT